MIGRPPREAGEGIEEIADGLEASDGRAYHAPRFGRDVGELLAHDLGRGLIVEARAPLERTHEESTLAGAAPPVQKIISACADSIARVNALSSASRLKNSAISHLMATL